MFIFLISLETLLIARIIMMSDIKIGDWLNKRNKERKDGGHN